MIKQNIKEYIEKFTRIENELALLREEKKDLDSDYKDKLDLKAVKAAIRIAKIKEKLDIDDEKLDEVIKLVES
ncbi:MAG: hypothetical protein ACW98X_21965 [Promethearchaeota archaeon]